MIALKATRDSKVAFKHDFVPFLLMSDEEAPVVDFCESPPIFLVTNEQDLERKSAEVTWDPPIFHDNSLKDVLNVTLVLGNDPVKHSPPHATHVLPIGQTTQIKYTAKDEAGNEAFCDMEITVQGSTTMY